MATEPVLDRRRAGVLLHPTSLPGTGGAGQLGADARRFADLLEAAGLSVWQMLPVGPTGDSHSPYQVGSAFAGDPRLIDPRELAADGWLTEEDLRQGADAGEPWRVLPAMAWNRFRSVADEQARAAFARYRQSRRAWLLPYTLFRLCRRLFGTAGWWHWPEAVRLRESAAMVRLLEAHGPALQALAFEQYLFDEQWSRLRTHAAGRGVALFGDVPIYVDLDSADVWWHRHLFRVSGDGQPEAVAGVPPDYFSSEGQAWGNPLYDWAAHERSGFRWWLDRLGTQLQRFDLLRIDHFRGLQAFWEIPAGATSARFGQWRDAPGDGLLTAVRRALGRLPIVAEDLGTITPEVHALRDRFGLPGMLILQFAFDGSPDNPYLPAHHREQAVVYPGTHDNDTLLGWFQSLDPGTRQYVQHVLGCGPEEVPAAVLTAVWDSPARLAVFPWQDLLGLGTAARMNTPGTTRDNWRWRFDWSQVPADLAANCRGRAERSGRIP